MDDAGDFREVVGQLQHAVAVGDVQLAEDEILVRRQQRQPRFLQGDVVIVVEIVHPQHGIAARQQRARDMRTR